MAWEVPRPEWVRVDTVGPRGQRVFFLQVRGDGRTAAVKLEKQQVAAMADYFESMLEDLPPLTIDDTDPVHPLDPPTPIDYDFVVGAVGVAYQPDDDRVLVVLEELVADDLDDDEDDDDLDDDLAQSIRFTLSRRQVADLVEQARTIVAAGRPPCPYCGRPLDGDGSFCPCSN